MPRLYVRKTNRGEWTQETLVQACQTVLDKKLSMRNAAKQFGIPYSTLQERLKNGNYDPVLLGIRPIFSYEDERDISNHIKDLSKLFYGLTPLQLRKAAFEFPEKKKSKT